MFSLIVDECSVLKVKLHLFGGDGKYMKSNIPLQIVFSFNRVDEIVYSYNDDVNVIFVLFIMKEGFIMFTVFMIIVGFV